MGEWQPQPRFAADVASVAKWISDPAVSHWLIVTHERPDGDAIGSALAMTQICDSLGKSWTFAVAEPMPERFSYLAGFNLATEIKQLQSAHFHHVIAVDCADGARFDLVKSCIASDAVIVNIDHHRTNPRFGVAALVDEHAAATCELIYHVARQLRMDISTNLAKCLYTGIITDTGGFAYPNTSRDVHQIAAELLASGVQPYDIAEPALESRTWAQMHLLQMALSNLTVSRDGKYAAIYVTRGMLEGAGADEDDSEGLVGFARSIDTVEVGMLFRETRDGRVKASLRSKRSIDVSRIAQVFGGGGHERAAGCVLSLTLDEAMDAVTEEVERALTSI